MPFRTPASENQKNDFALQARPVRLPYGSPGHIEKRGGTLLDSTQSLIVPMLINNFLNVRIVFIGFIQLFPE